MHSISFISTPMLPPSFWRACIVAILVMALCVPGFCIGIDERLLTKNTIPSLTFGITPAYTIPNHSVTLSGGLYNFLVTLPGRQIIIERSVEYGPYEQIASVITGNDGTYLYLDTPPGRSEHKIYYRVAYIEDGKRITETEPIYLYLGTQETVDLLEETDGNNLHEKSKIQSQIREVPGYQFMINSTLSEENEQYLVVTVFISTTMQGSTSGIILASPCGDDLEMLAIGIPSQDGTITFPTVEGCTEYYALCPVVDGEITMCTEPFIYIKETKEVENTEGFLMNRLGRGNSQFLREWLSTSQFGDLIPNTSELASADEDEVIQDPEVIVTTDESDTGVSPIQIGTEPIFLELFKPRNTQRGVPTLVEASVTSMNGAPVADAEILLFLSSDLVYWYHAARSITNADGIAGFYVDAGHLATLKARVAFLGDAVYSTGESNTIFIVS